MADDTGDPFASIIDNCRCSSSQEDLLEHSNFAREDEIFSDGEVDGKPPEVEYSGGGRRELDGGGEVVGCSERRDLGHEGEEKGLEKLEGGRDGGGEGSGERSESGRKRKKARVLAGEKGGSPLVHCSGRVVIEREDEGREVVVFSGDVKVEFVSPLRCVAPHSVEKLGGEGGGDEELDEERVEDGVRRKLEFGGDTEVMEVEDEEGDVGGVDETRVVDMCVEYGEGSGERKGDEKEGDVVCGSEEEIKRRGKRALPLSMFGQWGEGLGNEGGGLKEASVEAKGGGGFEVANVKGRREGGLKKVYREESREGGLSREERKEGGVEEAIVEGSREGGLKVCREESREDGLEEASIEGSREVGLKEESIKRSRAGSLEEAYVEESREGALNKVNREENRECGLEKADVEESREGVLNQASGEESKEAGIAEASLEGSRKSSLKEACIEGSSRGGLKEAGVKGSKEKEDSSSLEGNRDGKSMNGETAMKCMLDVLRMLAGERYYDADGNGEIDILETAKSRGMTFPRSRFLPEMEEDE